MISWEKCSRCGGATRAVRQRLPDGGLRILIECEVCSLAHDPYARAMRTGTRMFLLGLAVAGVCAWMALRR